ncbi:Thiosulfate sulfurtransferase GlpE [Marinomonas aquimarina]|uniref:Thiosulfate sulfurtransferase GlpE n=1 Tax=Marinomonas aquimarina TaxID=295068 RepID=A0A1A8TMY0_9GAMM|nr:rhodanese-like domain-containing protein [Marinomonas aquimarina]SBS35412.1 Thiosulfate sulfurtransferase GlpE [Marinomonas aquimarina]
MMNQLIEFSLNHWEMVAVFVFIAATLIFVETRGGARALSTNAATNLINDKDAVVVDIRPANEFRTGHLTGSINIPSAKLKDSAGTLEKYKSSPIILVCKTGMTAGSSAKELIKSGFDVYKLQGGITEWQNAGLPLVKK